LAARRAQTRRSFAIVHNVWSQNGPQPSARGCSVSLIVGSGLGEVAVRGCRAGPLSRRTCANGAWMVGPSVRCPAVTLLQTIITGHRALGYGVFDNPTAKEGDMTTHGGTRRDAASSEYLCAPQLVTASMLSARPQCQWVSAPSDGDVPRKPNTVRRHPLAARGIGRCVSRFGATGGARCSGGK
jgi:hypothetical protein